jgi:hypothetical protein
MLSSLLLFGMTSPLSSFQKQGPLVPCLSSALPTVYLRTIISYSPNILQGFPEPHLWPVLSTTWESQWTLDHISLINPSHSVKQKAWSLPYLPTQGSWAYRVLLTCNPVPSHPVGLAPSQHNFLKLSSVGFLLQLGQPLVDLQTWAPLSFQSSRNQMSSRASLLETEHSDPHRSKALAFKNLSLLWVSKVYFGTKGQGADILSSIFYESFPWRVHINEVTEERSQGKEK